MTDTHIVVQNTETYAAMENSKICRSLVFSPSRSTTLNEKLITTLSRFRESKDSFALLKIEIVKGLAEAQDVFTSISIPLVRLVDLKVQELERDGRKTAVFMTDNFETSSNFSSNYESFRSLLSTTRHLLQSSEGETFKSKAALHTEEIMTREKIQIKQLISLLKMIESLVRSQERDIMQKFDDHRDFACRMQKRFVSETTGLHHRVQSMKQENSQLAHGLNPSEQGYKALLSMALKLQQSVFDGFRKSLSHLKEEMEGMVNDLASHMCQPLLSYLKRLNSEGIISLVRQLQSLVETMETDFISHIPSLLAANNSLLLQLRNLEMELKERQNVLQNTMNDLVALSKAIDAKEQLNISLSNALVKKGEENEEFRKRLRTQSKRIEELKKDIKETDAKSSDVRQSLLAKEKQLTLINGQRAEAFQKSEDYKRQLSALQEENFELKKMVEYKNIRHTESAKEMVTVDETAEQIVNWINEINRSKGEHNLSKEKAATDFLKLLDAKLKHLLQPKADKYFFSPSLTRQKPQMSRPEKPIFEEKIGDDFLWELLEKREQLQVSCSNPSRNLARENDKAGGIPKAPASRRRGESLGIGKSQYSPNLILSSPPSSTIWGCSVLKEQGPITRSCARRMLESPHATPKPSQLTPDNRNSPSSNLPWNLRPLSKRESPNSNLRFSSPSTLWHR